MVLVLLYYILYYYYSKKKAQEKAGHAQNILPVMTSLPLTWLQVAPAHNTSSNATWAVPIYYCLQLDQGSVRIGGQRWQHPDSDWNKLDNFNE
jgi:hypothetical protein